MYYRWILFISEVGAIFNVSPRMPSVGYRRCIKNC